MALAEMRGKVYCGVFLTPQRLTHDTRDLYNCGTVKDLWVAITCRTNQ